MAPQWMSRKLRPYQASIFDKIGQLARSKPCVNLGQGFPDFDAPEPVKEAAIRAIRDGHNQYAPLGGVPALTSVLAETHLEDTGLSYDPATEVSVFDGATEAMYAAITAICEPGDEFIVFAPVYDTYIPCVEMCGGRAVPVPLAPPRWRFDPDRLRAAFSPKTKAVILNTPHNPTGAVFDHAELEAIAALCREFDAFAITDEVYEYLVYDGAEHISLAELEGMRERTIVISSTAKTFSATGWKIGYTFAPAEATQAMRRLHQFIAFAVATPFQHAMAAAFQARAELIPKLHGELARKRERLCNGLRELGFRVDPPQGTFFALADFSPFSDKDDVDYVIELLEAEAAVAAIPISVFFPDPANAPKNYIRFCFAKKDETLDAGLAQLARSTRRPSL